MEESFNTSVPEVDLGSPIEPDEVISHLRTTLSKLERDYEEIVARLKSFLDTANDVVFILSIDGVFDFLSPKLTDVLGYDPEDLRGTHFSAVIHPEDLPACEKFFERVLKTGEPEAGLEYRVLHADGTWRWHDTNGAPLLTATGELSGMLGIGRDIQDRKMAAEEVGAALTRAEAASAARSRFIATMSHEIRTPLGGILGLLDLLSLDEQDDEKLRLLSYARQAGHGLQRIVDDVLDFSKMEAGVLVLQEEKVDIRALIESVRAVAASADNARGRKIRVEIGDGVPKCFVGDPSRLRQVISNLLSNAIRYSESGEIVIRASSQTRAERQSLYVEVQDFGIGIAEQDKESLFKDFAQIENPLTATAKGTGLGLAICKRIVDKLNGEIGLISEIGKGSTFWFEVDILPVSACEEMRDLDSISKTNLSGKRVLLAEDNVINQNLFMRFMDRMGIATDLAPNGRLAIEKFAPDKYDLVLMDVAMPEVDGFEATQRIRQKFQGHQMPPIFAITAHATELVEAEAKLSGVDRVLPKPIPFETLREELSKALAPQQDQRASESDKSASAVTADGPAEGDCLFLLEFMRRDVFDSLITDFESRGLLNLIKSYVLDSQNRIANMLDADAIGETTEVAFQAHSIKGASRAVGLADMEKWAEEIETGTTYLNGSTVWSTAESMILRLDEIDTALSNHISSCSVPEPSGSDLG